VYTKFLLVFNSNYLHILHCFWDIARYWSKIADCDLLQYFTSIWRLFQFYQDLWHQQTGVLGLLYVHGHLINAIGSQKVSCLCLLDLSAAFDTIDHNISISCLSSWFGIHSFVLSWFKSYLSSHSFRVKCDNNLSSFHTSSRRLCSRPSTLRHVHYPS